MDRSLRMFTWVYLTAFKELDPHALTLTHIERMEQIAFDAEMCKSILHSVQSEESLTLRYLEKLAYIKLINGETAISGPEVDLIELANIVMDKYSLMQTNDELLQDYLSAVYFKVLLPYPSLFFFRSRHLFATLELLAGHPIFGAEKSFWHKSEDLILRSKGQLTTQELVRVVSIYRHVPVSQMFWNEMEHLILSKSADFKGNKDMLLQTMGAFAHRKNETFWKVFGSYVRTFADELTFDEYVQVLDILDYHDGETLF